MENQLAQEELSRQKLFMADVAEMMKVRARGPVPMAYVRTYGCQQNVADGEKIKGLLSEMGFSFAETPEEADFILFNTCAVREHAQDRVFGNVGALKNIKRRHPGTIIAVCGCMTEQEHVAERFKKSYPFVNIVFGTHVIHRLPEMLYTTLTDSKRVFLRGHEGEEVLEGIPTRRDGTSRAWVTVMLGCDNFCSYCIVPYVRGREKSRRPEEIVKECRQLIEAGYKEITLLGQNVNSYGKDLGLGVDFADLIRMINDIPGEFLIRFMTSHPKDATEKLFKTMAECEKCAHQLHLPVQSGNDRVLKAMNRNYTAEKYLAQVKLARSYMPDLVITTDIIVGFPGETDEEFEDTIKLCDEVRYDAMFTFIYSKRVGTPAASMPDAATREDKQRRFDRLLEAANRVSAEKHAEYIGKTVRVLVDGETGKDEYNLSSRTNGGRLVHLAGDKSLIGQFIDVKITSGNTWALYGKVGE